MATVDELLTPFLSEEDAAFMLTNPKLAQSKAMAQVLRGEQGLENSNRKIGGAGWGTALATALQGYQRGKSTRGLSKARDAQATAEADVEKMALLRKSGEKLRQEALAEKEGAAFKTYVPSDWDGTDASGVRQIRANKVSGAPMEDAEGMIPIDQWNAMKKAKAAQGRQYAADDVNHPSNWKSLGNGMLINIVTREKLAEADAVAKFGNEVKAGEAAGTEMGKGRVQWEAAEPGVIANIEAIQDQHEIVLGNLDEIETYLNNSEGEDDQMVDTFFGYVPGSPGFDLRNKITNITSNIAVDKLISMKESSPTGASGFGQLSDKEREILEAVFGKFNLGGTLGEMKQVVKDARKGLNNTRRRMSDQYMRERKYWSGDGSGERPDWMTPEATEGGDGGTFDPEGKTPEELQRWLDDNPG